MTSYILPHNLITEPLIYMIDANDMINSMQSEIDVAEYHISMGEDPHIQVGEMRKQIDLHKLFLDYLWAKYSFEQSLDDIEDFERLIDYFEERAHSPVIQSDIEDNLQAAEELSQNLSVMIDRLVLEETCFLIKKREYFYVCIKRIDSVIEALSMWDFCALDAKHEKLALLKEIELLEEQIQRGLM